MTPLRRIGLLFLAGCLLVALTGRLPSAPVEIEGDIAQLIGQLGDDDFSVRERAAQRLVKIGRSAIGALERAARSDDAEVRKRAAEIIETIRTSPSFALDGIQDKDPAVRRQAIEVIEKSGAKDQAIIDALARALKDSDETVRDAAVGALLRVAPNTPGMDKALPKKASVNGKYKTLQRRIRVEADKASYTEFHDWGRYEGTSWAGYTDIPPGYWVYVYPHWYIWKDLGNGQ